MRSMRRELVVNFPNQPMKTLLTASLSVALAVTALAQTEPTPPLEPGQTPAPAAAPQQQVDPLAPGLAPAQPADPAAAQAMQPPPGPAVPGAPVPTPAAPTTPQAVQQTAAAATQENPFAHRESDNPVINTFYKGGWIMYPLVLTSIVAIAVVLERVFWWLFRWMRRDPKRVEKVFTAIENGDVAEASRLSRGSRDPVLRMMWNGLNHQHASLQGALQVAAGIEIKRAGRFLVVMDTLVTLAPLLGLLGTVTGLMKSFSFLGNEELAVVAVTGGIAEALIATAAGLGIAIFALIPFNYFTSRVTNLEFELQTAATNLEVMLEANEKVKKELTAPTTHHSA
jgi:biopolymer transport protein ExbB